MEPLLPLPLRARTCESKSEEDEPEPLSGSTALATRGWRTAGAHLAIWDQLVGTKCHFNHLKHTRLHSAQPCLWGLTRTTLAI